MIKKLLLLLLATTLCLTACMPATLSEKQEKDSKKEEDIGTMTSFNKDFLQGKKF